jgi:hypothetical protein
MPEKMVRVYDKEMDEITTIPARELAPGMMRCQIEDIEGEVWVDANSLKTEKGPFLYPPCSEEIRAYFREFAETFHDVCPKTVDQWEVGFRRELNPEKEIAIWLHMASVFRRFTEGRNLSPEQREDIFQLILAAMNNGPDAIKVTFKARTLSQKRVEQILDAVFPKKESEGGESPAPPS